MEQNQESKHTCKFCNKRYPCGRSLGGHVRSHLGNISEAADEKMSKKNVCLSNSGSDTKNGVGYELRENPKKSWRLDQDSDGKNSSADHDKLCKHCGRVFASWKALFGHMKCHRVPKSLEDQDSCNASKQKMVVVQDSQSENESAAPSRKKRSMRRRTRCMIATPNSFSISSVNSESEQEQEEIVALSLIMLSKDVRSWDGLSPFAEFSVSNSSEIVKSRKLISPNSGHGDLGSEGVNLDENRPEFFASRNPRKGCRTVKLGLSIDASQVEQGKNSTEIELGEAQFRSSEYGSGKKKREDASDTTFNLEFAKKSVVADASDSVIGNTSHKRSKFECSICNKIFHSYQALGGHKASHNKLKGSFSPKIEVSEKTSEVRVSPDLATDGKFVELCNYDSPIDNHVASEDNAETSSGIKNTGGHMCQVCLKVFPSGQALGGHKRSHLLEGSKAKNTQQGIEIPNQVPETRDFLDLNRPAPIEENGNTHTDFKPWWMDNSQQHEPLLSLISN